MLKISAISLVLRTREITDILNAFDEIYLVFTSKKVNILYIFFNRHIMGVRILTIYMSIGIEQSIISKYCIVTLVVYSNKSGLNRRKSHFSIVPFTFQAHCGFTAGDSIMSWYVVLGFNGSLRQYFSLYRAISQRQEFR